VRVSARTIAAESAFVAAGSPSDGEHRLQRAGGLALAQRVGESAQRDVLIAEEGDAHQHEGEVVAAVGGQEPIGCRPAEARHVEGDRHLHDDRYGAEHERRAVAGGDREVAQQEGETIQGSSRRLAGAAFASRASAARGSATMAAASAPGHLEISAASTRSPATVARSGGGAAEAGADGASSSRPSRSATIRPTRSPAGGR